ncbi:hypothetical protein STIAU_0377, partial [Stigmatella aurantiaca DW4/3-1]
LCIEVSSARARSMHCCLSLAVSFRPPLLPR